MNKLLLPSLLLFLVAFVRPVQAGTADADSSVVFRAAFLRNEYQRYDVSKSTYTLKGRDTVELQRIGFLAEVVVTDSSDRGYLCRWTLSSFALNSSNADLQALVAGARPVVLTCRTDPSGEFDGFVDARNIPSCLQQTLPVVLDRFAHRSDSASKSDVLRIYAFRDELESLMLEFIPLFHQFHGLGYDLGETVSVPVEVPSRFCAQPLPAEQRKRLVSVDADHRTAQMVWATVLDQEAFRKALAESLRLQPEQVRNLRQEEIGNASLDLATGWPMGTWRQREAMDGPYTYGEQLNIQYR